LHWLVQCGWDIAERFTNAAYAEHGLGVEPDGFRCVGALKRKVDCNAVYKLLGEGLWWPLLAGKRLALVSGHGEAMAARLMDVGFVRASGGDEVTWSVATSIICPPANESKWTHWPQMRGDLFVAEWDLLPCAAGSLSELLCEHARQSGRTAFDIGALDRQLLLQQV
jgi:hypothetical protein